MSKTRSKRGRTIQPGWSGNAVAGDGHPLLEDTLGRWHAVNEIEVMRFEVVLLPQPSPVSSEELMALDAARRRRASSKTATRRAKRAQRG